MKRLIIIITLLAIAGTAQAQDVACGTWQKGASSNSTVMRMVQTGTFTNIAGAGTQTEQSFAVCQKSAVLDRIVVTSTNCANCDVAITEVTGTGGTRLVMENTTMGAATVNAVAYTTFLDAIDLGCTVSTSAAGTGDTASQPYVFVRVTNNDAGVRTVTVRLYWKSE